MTRYQSLLLVLGLFAAGSLATGPAEVASEEVIRLEQVVVTATRTEQRLKDVPVIFLTAKGGGDALAEGFESGAIMYINKPFTANKLLTIVNTMLESRATS